MGKMVKGEVYAVLFAALAVRILYSASLFPETSTRHTISNQWSRGTRKRGEKKRKSEPTDRKRRLCNATLQQNVWVEPTPSTDLLKLMQVKGVLTNGNQVQGIVL